MSTYLTVVNGDLEIALGLYSWNARVSTALMLPVHFVEVAVRNAVAEALERVYHDRWPWNESFERSLPRMDGGRYSAFRDLVTTRAVHDSTGKVIADLNFVFWQQMFARRHGVRIWDEHLHNVFPNAPPGASSRLRARIHDDLQRVRLLRNRLAHHEPVFARDLTGDLSTMIGLIGLRSQPLAEWVEAMQDVTDILAERPWWPNRRRP